MHLTKKPVIIKMPAMSLVLRIAGIFFAVYFLCALLSPPLGVAALASLYLFYVALFK